MRRRKAFFFGASTLFTFLYQSSVFANTMELPFNYGETWVVCQGYNNYNITHHRGFYSSTYALDFAFVEPGNQPNNYLSTDHESGYGCQKTLASAGKKVRSPVDGTVIRITSSGDIVYIRPDNRKDIAIELGHIKPYVSVKSPVRKGQIIGEVLDAVTCSNIKFCNIPHVHLAVRNGRQTIPIGNMFQDYSFDADPNPAKVEFNAHRGQVVWKAPPLSVIAASSSVTPEKRGTAKLVYIADSNKGLSSAVFHVVRDQKCNSVNVLVKGPAVQNKKFGLFVYVQSESKKFPNQDNSGGGIYYIEDYVGNASANFPLTSGNNIVTVIPLIDVSSPSSKGNIRNTGFAEVEVSCSEAGGLLRSSNIMPHSNSFNITDKPELFIPRTHASFFVAGVASLNSKNNYSATINGFGFPRNSLAYFNVPVNECSRVRISTTGIKKYTVEVKNPDDENSWWRVVGTTTRQSVTMRITQDRGNVKIKYSKDDVIQNTTVKVTLTCIEKLPGTSGSAGGTSGNTVNKQEYSDLAGLASLDINKSQTTEEDSIDKDNMENSIGGEIENNQPVNDSTTVIDEKSLPDYQSSQGSTTTENNNTNNSRASSSSGSGGCSLSTASPLSVMPVILALILITFRKLRKT